MVQVTSKDLLMISSTAKNTEKLAAVINQFSATFGLTTRKRMAHFLAQCAHETMGFRRLEEMASGAAYEGNKVLGNTQKGDGVRFKGRGLLQLTGRANYQAYARSKFCVGDLMSHPEWLAHYPGCVKSAMWYWWSRGLNALADVDNLRAITKKINGGYNGYDSREAYLARSKRVFGL